MSTLKDPAELVYNWWERFLNAQSDAFGGDREFTELSNKLDEVRARLFADQQVTEPEIETLLEKMEAVATLYLDIAARKGMPVDPSLPATRESFLVFRETAEIHFQTLAGDDRSYYRGGLLGQFIETADPDPVAHRIVLDLLTSASSSIAHDKLFLLRAHLSLLGDGTRQRALLERVRFHLAAELSRPLWTAGGRVPALGLEAFDQASRFESFVSIHPVPLPEEVRGNNRMLPNRPIAGRDAANRSAVHAALADLRSENKLFLDRIEPTANPVGIAVKIELNLGIEGAPSVTDPAVTYAVLAELLDAAEARGIAVRFSVGDSNGIENAPIGCTSLDVMRETGNYHAALKAALEFAVRPSMPDSVRLPAFDCLEKILSCERAAPPVFFGSFADRVSSSADRAAAEAAASPWVACVDYDQAGYRPVAPQLGPLARAIWGSNLFHIAEPWVAADYRVHVTRGASNHLFAGWTGSLKGLIGLHALGGRPADRGMRLRGEAPLDVLNAVMRMGSFTGLFATRACVPDFARLASSCDDAACRQACEQSAASYRQWSEMQAGRQVWADGAAAIERELRLDQAAGVLDVEVMAKMRRLTVALLADAESAAPGFRESLWQGVADATRAFLLTMWRMREQIPVEMRDERLGMRIGLLTRLSHQADLVVQGLPKIGIGGGPDAYVDVQDVGVVVAGTDEVSVDLAALRAAEVPGNPWAFNHPIHGALQFGPGPMCWEEIRSS